MNTELFTTLATITFFATILIALIVMFLSRSKFKSLLFDIAKYCLLITIPLVFLSYNQIGFAIGSFILVAIITILSIRKRKRK